MAIWKLLGFGGEGGEEETRSSQEAETETVRKIVDELNHMEPTRARYVACFSYLLGRVAHADLDISAEETAAMERIVMERSGLPEQQAILVVQMAKSQNVLFGGTENFLVTREFGKMASREQKFALLHCLFGVSVADESISTAEDNEIRKISRELNLTHDDFIAVRLTYKDYLATKKKSS